MEWIFSTEPKEYPWSKVQEGAARWDGIRGPAARKYMREIQAGDRIWGYHASPQKALVCWAVAAAPAYPDPADRKSTRLNSSHEFVSRMPSSA